MKIAEFREQNVKEIYLIMFAFITGAYVTTTIILWPESAIGEHITFTIFSCILAFLTYAFKTGEVSDAKLGKGEGRKCRMCGERKSAMALEFGEDEGLCRECLDELIPLRECLDELIPLRECLDELIPLIDNLETKAEN